MKAYIITFLLVVSGNLFSQRFYYNNYSEIVEGKQLERIDEQYFEGNFSSALISSDETETVYKLRYNAYFDEIEYEDNGKRYYLAKTIDETVYFRELNKKYVCMNYTYDGENKTGFLVEIFVGDKYSVYKREKIEYFIGHKADEVKTTGSQQYKKLKDVYFIEMNENLVPIPNSKKKFSSMFGEKESEVFEYLKENKISLNDLMDLRQLFRHLNEME
ncbi:MAG: hypothetical protein WCY25_06540 [Moheibacter sp.]